MSSHPEGLAIARERIVHEKQGRTGFPDLAGDRIGALIAQTKTRVSTLKHKSAETSVDCAFAILVEGNGHVVY
jgi:hypothetical protein